MVLQEERGLRGLKEAIIDNCLMKQRELVFLSEKHEHVTHVGI